jgi:uncharacterized protein
MARLEMHEVVTGPIAGGNTTADVLFELGLMYCIGRDVEQDYVAAHKWFNLAALRGSKEARDYRIEIAQEMSPADVAEAQRQARAWLTMH